MNTPQDSRSSKILEDLQLKKQQLQKGLPIIPQHQPPYESQLSINSINSVARATFATAQSTSVGHFIATDSAFGNSILPVLPRFD